MSQESIDKKEIQLLSDIFASPKDAFSSYIQNVNFSRFSVFRIHLFLFVLAPVFKLLHNLFFTFVGSVHFGWEAPPKLTDGITTAIAVYPLVLFLVYHFDILLLRLRTGKASIDVIEERDLLLISFLPFSASAVFWIFPKPFNFFLILSAFIYCLYLSKTSLEMFFGFTIKQFIVFVSYILILCMTLSAVALTIFNLIRK
ncbi:MAG TPA: hypothetical protein PK079_24980 [Leptospiraceae bacterium]|nr:hypothetical protein [Leptospiraceae bacterium]HMW06097.1 hypothetical protein [Leptospiraceae bacterium]HMX30775.1 hypothetical protein [Leptospiraceae bacterium]HMY31759.1 hypothetical protein [Leptospiraceae bacterium]HMZ63090.1 hypothetical protein [Leptospiraceae bacterium]